MNDEQPVERWKAATRGDALKALANGERVETSGDGRLASWLSMRWDETGPQFQIRGTGEFVPDQLVRHSLSEGWIWKPEES